MVSAHPFPESLRIWSRAERDAALGSGKKLKSHCQLGVELGHKCKMLAVTFTFQSAAKRTVLLEGNSPFSESHPVVFRLSTAAAQAVALCACSTLGLACQSLPLFLANSA